MILGTFASPEAERAELKCEGAFREISWGKEEWILRITPRTAGSACTPSPDLQPSLVPYHLSSLCFNT